MGTTTAAQPAYGSNEAPPEAANGSNGAPAPAATMGDRIVKALKACGKAVLSVAALVTGVVLGILAVAFTIKGVMAASIVTLAVGSFWLMVLGAKGLYRVFHPQDQNGICD